MQNLKDKLLNFELTPPPQNWQKITDALEADKDNKIHHLKKNQTTLYLTSAAAVLIIIFSIIFFFNNPDKKSLAIAAQEKHISNDIKEDNTRTGGEDKITVPNSVADDDEHVAKYNKKPGDTVKEFTSKQYITITGPEGKPVKISSKAATLIVASNDQNPSRPVWNDKVKKWKDIMLANTLAPTTANFLDIVELTHALRVSNP